MKLTILTGSRSPDFVDWFTGDLEKWGCKTVTYSGYIEVWTDYPAPVVEFAQKCGLDEHEAVHLTHPGEINKPHIRQRIEMLADLGFRSSNIILALNFVCDNPGKIAGKFQVIKNRVYHAKAN